MSAKDDDDKQRELDEIKAAIVKNKVTPELAKAAKNLVFGEGSADAQIVFIGEAPGKNEDLTGRPFVGAAGKFLDEMLKGIGLERKDVYITSILKYRPPGNRDPLPDEKKAFLPYLQAQLEVIQPKIVVTLGRHSTNCFLPDLQISKIHGEAKRIRIRVHGLAGGQQADGGQGASEKRTEPYKSTVKGASQLASQPVAAKLGRAPGSARRQDVLVLVILPLFHPAAALYNNSMRQTLLDDFARIPAVIKQIDTKK